MRRIAGKLGSALLAGGWIFLITIPLLSFAVTPRSTANLEHESYFALIRVDGRKLQDPLLVFRKGGAGLGLTVALLGVVGVLGGALWGWKRARGVRERARAGYQALRERATAALHHRRFPLVLGGIVLALLLVAPTLLAPLGEAGRDKALNWLIWIGIWSIMASGLNITVGMAGLLVLGYAAFYAVGAYTFAILATRTADWAATADAPGWIVFLHESGSIFWISIPLAAILAAAVGLFIGLPSLRLRGDYLAIVTLGFGETVRYFLKNVPSLTGGENGIDVRAKVPNASLLGFRIESEVHYFYLVLVLVAFTVFAVSRLNHSRIGRAWIALREDEIAAEAMGVPTTRMKLLAFSLSAVWGGIAGVFFVRYQGFVNPNSFTFNESVLVLSMVVLGGMGSNIGVLLGAAILYSIPRFLRDYSNDLQKMGWDVNFSDYRLLLFGLIMVLMMIFRPQGLLGGQRRKIELGQPNAAPPGNGTAPAGAAAP